VGPAGPSHINTNGHLARIETVEISDVSACLSHQVVSVFEREDGQIGPYRDAPLLPDSRVRAEGRQRRSARACAASTTEIRPHQDSRGVACTRLT
jgi:hypothetical protein